MGQGQWNRGDLGKSSRKTARVLKFLFDETMRLKPAVRRVPLKLRSLGLGLVSRIGVRLRADVHVAELDTGENKYALVEIPAPLAGGGFSRPAWRCLVSAGLFSAFGGSGRPLVKIPDWRVGLVKLASRLLRTPPQGCHWKAYARASVFGLAWLQKRGFRSLDLLGPWLATAHVWTSSEGLLPIETRLELPKDRPRLQIQLQLGTETEDGCVALLLSEIENRLSFEGQPPAVWLVEVPRGRMRDRLRALGFREACRFLREDTVLMETSYSDLEIKLRLWRSGPSNRRWLGHAKWVEEDAQASLSVRRTHGKKTSPSLLNWDLG